MQKITRKFLSVFSLLALNFVHFNLWAQNTSSVDMADLMRSNGKIYVVVAMVLLVFAGIVFYMLRIEKKMDRKEEV